MTQRQFVDPRYAKTAEYRRVIGAIASEGKCPFCPENFRYHRKPILKRTSGWVLTKNSWPYRRTRHHFIIIATAHKERFDELAARDFRAVSALVRWAVKKYRISGGGLILRFGDTRLTGATVCHLHFHLVVPKIKRGAGRAYTVPFPIG